MISRARGKFPYISLELLRSPFSYSIFEACNKSTIKGAIQQRWENAFSTNQQQNRHNHKFLASIVDCCTTFCPSCICPTQLPFLLECIYISFRQIMPHYCDKNELDIHCKRMEMPGERRLIELGRNLLQIVVQFVWRDAYFLTFPNEPFHSAVEPFHGYKLRRVFRISPKEATKIKYNPEWSIDTNRM